MRLVSQDANRLVLHDRGAATLAFMLLAAALFFALLGVIIVTLLPPSAAPPGLMLFLALVCAAIAALWGLLTLRSLVKTTVTFSRPDKTVTLAYHGRQAPPAQLVRFDEIEAVDLEHHDGAYRLALILRGYRRLPLVALYTTRAGQQELAQAVSTFLNVPLIAEERA